MWSLHINTPYALRHICMYTESCIPRQQKKSENIGQAMGSWSYMLLSICIIHVGILPAILNHHNYSEAALPLSTDSRWIVDQSGQRVKLSCINWVTHLEAMIAEGLSKQAVDVMSKRILGMGFNCVRLTWPLFLFTNESLANLTVRQSFQKLGLLHSIAGFQANNPSIIDLPLIKAYQV